MEHTSVFLSQFGQFDKEKTAALQDWNQVANFIQKLDLGRELEAVALVKVKEKLGGLQHGVTYSQMFDIFGQINGEETSAFQILNKN